MKSRQAIEVILNAGTYLSPFQSANLSQNPAELGKGQAGFSDKSRENDRDQARSAE